MQKFTVTMRENNKILFIPAIIFLLIAGFSNTSTAQELRTIQSGVFSFKVPGEYLTEREEIPDLWITSVEDVAEFLYRTVKRGRIEVIGTSAGGRPLRAVVYGRGRQGRGTSTFSGSLGFRNVKAYRGPDHDKKVYMGIAGVHGGEFEGMIGMVNLISVLETGKDLRGMEWPEINQVADQLDRIVLIPMMNPDGRARIPLRM